MLTFFTNSIRISFIAKKTDAESTMVFNFTFGVDATRLCETWILAFFLYTCKVLGAFRIRRAFRPWRWNDNIHALFVLHAILSLSAFKSHHKIIMVLHYKIFMSFHLAWCILIFNVRLNKMWNSLYDYKIVWYKITQVSQKYMCLGLSNVKSFRIK